ncbi:hypothetical protein PRIPAC_88014 [Pristionchus pacificus]|uniref:Uncharacterized protein n=1 Tax=Pristionchus pacificus TaxID=54126 RepID=A0A454XTV4_PRIPA|nr:hypothetical protein PRIPAC_88014 [Pristionchus pacificus]|eukprot:PDM82954.1 hypothetical protein PRIPAC_37347 [Pristionchus pacificus]
MSPDSANIVEVEKGISGKDVAPPKPGILQRFRLPFVILILILIAAYTTFLIVQSYLTWSKSMDQKS